MYAFNLHSDVRCVHRPDECDCRGSDTIEGSFKALLPDAEMHEHEMFLSTWTFTNYVEYMLGKVQCVHDPPAHGAALSEVSLLYRVDCTCIVTMNPPVCSVVWYTTMPPVRMSLQDVIAGCLLN